MAYIFNLWDDPPVYIRVTFQASHAAPGKTITFRNGIAMVVTPTGQIRDLQPGESPDTPWCWGLLCGDLLVYDSPTDQPEAVITMFRVVTAS